uniref:Variant surface glycoprotein n=1 Tax=Trypanosoma brucei TaxID=5691 RepID=S5G6P4_9TRYP|nr:variant surface glycoprotein [Trypanosoma brucei]
MHTPTAAALILTLTAAMQRHASATDGDVVKGASWTPLCSITADSEKLAANLLQNLIQNARDGETALQRLLRALVYNEATGGQPLSNATMAVWSLYAEVAGRAAARIQQTEAKAVVTAARNIGRLQGAISEFLESQADASADNKGCLQAAAGTTAVIVGKQQLYKEQPTCKMSWDEVKNEKTTTSVITTTGIKHTNSGGQENGQTIHSGQGTDCDISQPQSSFKLTYGSRGNNVAGHVPKLAAGYFTVDGTGIKIQKHDTLQDATAASPYLGKAIEALTAIAPAEETASIKTLSALKASPNFKDPARRYLLGKKPAETDADTQLGEKITNAYVNDDNAKKALFEVVDAYQIPDNLRPSPADDTLGKITSIHILMHLYFHYRSAREQAIQNRMQKLQEKAKHASDTISTDEKEKECNTKKGDACTGDCEWDKEKETCKPKEKGEQANQETGAKDGKTTNATGSNSFVINKAPILLTFLLF